MESHITWKKKWFGNVHEIYKQGTYVGNLTSKTFTYSSYATYNKHRIKFQSNGFLKQETDIINENTNSIIGSITYDTLKSNGIINLVDEQLVWRSVNWTNSRWEILSGNEIIIRSSNRMQNGSIFSIEDDPIKILIGLYISEFFNRANIVAIMAIFIVFISVFN